MNRLDYRGCGGTLLVFQTNGIFRFRAKTDASYILLCALALRFAFQKLQVVEKQNINIFCVVSKHAVQLLHTELSSHMSCPIISLILL